MSATDVIVTGPTLTGTASMPWGTDLLAASAPGGQLHGHDPDADGADHRDPRPGQAMNVFVLVLDEVEGVSVREVWAR